MEWNAASLWASGHPLYVTGRYSRKMKIANKYNILVAG
jgi:hypothetical protein